MKADKIHSGMKSGNESRWQNLIFLMTIGVLLGFSVFAGILHTGGFAQSQLMSLLQMFLAVAVLRLLFSNKYLIWISTGLLTIGLGLLGVGFLTSPAEPRLINEAANFVTAVFRYVSGYGEYNALYEQTFVWFLGILIGFFVVYFIYMYPNFLVLFLLFSGIFGFLISTYLFSYFFLFYLFIFCSLVFLLKQLNLACVKQTVRGGPFIRLALPLALLCTLLAGLIPVPPGEFVQDTFQTDFVESLRRLGDGSFTGTRPNYFSIQQTGFGGSDARRLGGNVNTDDGLFMLIRTDAPQPIYLTGATMDTYTGYGWENRLSESAPVDLDELSAHLALYEPFTTLLYYDPAPLSFSPLSDLGFSIHSSQRFTLDYFHQERTILIGGFMQPLYTVFYTGHVQGFAGYHREFALLQEESGQFITREPMPRSSWYTLTYLQFRGHAQPSDSYPGILRELAARMAAGHLSGFLIHGEEEIDFQVILQDYLIPRADWIHETYTALPEAFPERIGELARSITAGAENNYDRARLLEAHLRTFTYSLTPGTPPGDRDFVDYFLFDSQTGYCTYFATAFVTMARSLDIPARYVEGFLVSGAAPDETDFIHVLNSMGHAWGEAYLEGYGWHRFEPTPPESIILPPPTDDTEIDEPPIEQPTEPPDDVREFQPQPLPPTEFPTMPGRPDLQATADQGGIFQNRIWLIPIAVVMFLVLLLALRVLWVYNRGRRVRKYDNRKAVCHYFSILLKYLKLFRFEMKKTETVFRFYDRIAEEPVLQNDLLFPRELVEIYAKAYYGDVGLSLKERIRMEEEVYRIAEVIQRQKGKRKYLFYKYVRAVI